ncbi:hypothetical protein [Paenibacillus campi]|uniref:hypothetical protein n=1 Tax=Paenibacillus campi TaxID=3106031 RepID=UPI002AFFB112|nr:hypothetical protein [Paenibacillus sp. SGZ-1014]
MEKELLHVIKEYKKRIESESFNDPGNEYLKGMLKASSHIIRLIDMGTTSNGHELNIKID